MNRIALLVLLSVASPSWAKSPCPPEGTAGLWSREATSLCPQYKGRDFTRDIGIKSPDGKVTARIGYEHWWLEIAGRKVELPRRESNVTEDDSSVTENAEWGWAPDSKTFYLTQSENRAGVQGFYTLVFRVHDDRIEKVLDVNKIVQNEFDQHHKCVAYDARDRRYSEEADIAAIKWVDGSDQLLMVAETPYDSECSRGCFAGYLVSLSQQKIVQRYTARAVMAHWRGIIGDRLEEDFRRLTLKQRDAEP